MGHGIRAARTGAVIAGGARQGKIGFHAGKVAIERPRVRGLDGKELPLASWEQAVDEDWLGAWAMNLMLINVSTRKFRRAVRLPEGDVPAPAGSGVSKSAASRHFVALSAARMQEWMASDLSKLDLLVIQIDGIHMDERSGPGRGDRYRRRRATSIRSASSRARPRTPRRAGAHRQSRRARARSGGAAAVHHRRREGAVQGDPPDLRTRRADPALSGPQGPQHHGAIAQIAACFGPARVAASMGVGRRRQGREADPQSRPSSRTRLRPGSPARILEGIDEILTVTRLGLPKELRRSLACTNIIENVMGTVRRVCRNVKRWRSASMAMRWTAAAMQEAAKGFRRLKAHKQLPALRAALEAHQNKNSPHGVLARQANAA